MEKFTFGKDENRVTVNKDGIIKHGQFEYETIDKALEYAYDQEKLGNLIVADNMRKAAAAARKIYKNISKKIKEIEELEIPDYICDDRYWNEEEIEEANKHLDLYNIQLW